MVLRWGRVCSGLPIEPPVLDPSLPPVPPERPKADARQAALDAGWCKPSLLRMLPALVQLILGRLGNRSRAVHLDVPALARLGEAARRGAPDDVVLGANDVLTAHLTRMLARLCHPPGTSCLQVVVLDGRRHLLGVPGNFAGNASITALGARFDAGVGLAELAVATHRALSPWLERPSPTMAAQWCRSLELMHHRLFMANYDLAATYTRRPTVFYMNNFARLPIYDVDFGSGPPTRVIPHDLPDPILVWPAPPALGGVEVYLAGVLDRASRALGDEAWWSELEGGQPSPLA
jgi:hypothetical protein